MTDPRKPDDAIEKLLDSLTLYIGDKACKRETSSGWRVEVIDHLHNLRSAIAALRRERDDLAESYNLECEARRRWRNLADKLAGECATSMERAEATSRRLRARIASKLANVAKDAVLSRSKVLELVDDCCAAQLREGAKDE